MGHHASHCSQGCLIQCPDLGKFCMVLPAFSTARATELTFPIIAESQPKIAIRPLTRILAARGSALLFTVGGFKRPFKPAITPPGAKPQPARNVCLVATARYLYRQNGDCCTGKTGFKRERVTGQSVYECCHLGWLHG